MSNAFISLGRILGPLFGGIVYDLINRLPYLGGAAIIGVGFILSLWGLKDRTTQPG